MNGYGQLGNGTAIASSSTRVQVSGTQNWKTVYAATDYNTCGLTTTGEAYCWGHNDNGEIGDGNPGTADNPLPVLVSGGRSWTSIFPGYGHVCGVTDEKDAYCWGYNLRGQLGNGNTTNQSTPTLVLNDLGARRQCAISEYQVLGSTAFLSTADFLAVSAGAALQCGEAGLEHPHGAQETVKAGFPGAAMVLLGSLISSCLTSKGNDEKLVKDPVPVRNIQYVSNFTRYDGDSLYFTGANCSPNEVLGTAAKRTGDSLTIDFGVSGASLKVANIYELVEGSGVTDGVWRYVGNKIHKLPDSSAETVHEADSLLDMDHFFYGEEVLYIGKDSIGFSYPHLFMFPVSEIGFRNRNKSGFSLVYIGLDSVEISDNGHRVAIKYVPFHSITAKSNLHGPPISLKLDSCDLWDEGINDTWLKTFLYPNLETDLVQMAMSAKTGANAVRNARRQGVSW